MVERSQLERLIEQNKIVPDIEGRDVKVNPRVKRFIEDVEINEKFHRVPKKNPRPLSDGE